MTPTLSVIVPTYRGRDRLAEMVRPLLGDPALHELIVVVDGSEDGSLELLESLAQEDPRLRPLFIANSGDNAARQAGLEQATGDVVLFMDDDVIAHPGLVEGHVAHHAGGPGKVVIGYMPVAPAGPPRPEDFPARLYADWYEGQTERYERHPERILENLWQGNVSLSRQDALRVGIPSAAYTTRYGPDRELGLRLQAHGLTGVFDRALRAEHRYVRTPEAFLRDARSAGEGMWICHRLYPDVLGPLTHEHFEAGLSAKTRWAVRLSRRPGFRSLADRLLAAGTTFAGRLGRWHAQEQVAALRTKIAQQGAALESSRAHRPT